MASRTLILVDGLAALYRAFYAIRGLSSADGTPTNALFGFIRMLTQLREVWKPTHWVVVFDGGLPEARLELLPDYKGQRSPMPDELRSQIPLAEHYLEKAGIAWVRQPRQEADDVLASITSWARGEAADVLVATGDKDLYQLVDAQTRIVPVSGKGGAMGCEEVAAKTGVSPQNIRDWLALTGDSADNIPGVPGVGAKTAAKLLQEYGSLETLWRHFEEIARPKLREALAASRAVVERNTELVSLRHDLPIDLGWDDMAVRQPTAALIAFFEKYGFDSMADSLRQPDLF